MIAFGVSCVEPSVDQLVERLTVVLRVVYQYARKSIGRWFDSGHSDLCGSRALAVRTLFCYFLALLALQLQLDRESSQRSDHTEHFSKHQYGQNHVVILAASYLGDPCAMSGH